MKMTWQWKSRTLCFWIKRSKSQWSIRVKILIKSTKLGISSNHIGVNISTRMPLAFPFYNSRISLSDPSVQDLKENKEDLDKICLVKDPTLLRELLSLQILTYIQVKLLYLNSCLKFSPLGKSSIHIQSNFCNNVSKKGMMLVELILLSPKMVKNLLLDQTEPKFN